MVSDRKFHFELLVRWFEAQQTSAGVSRARSWASTVPGRLGPGDLFISANADEVLSREALHKLRSCQMAKETRVVSGALWMPMGNLDLAIPTDFPVKGRPHTFALPSIYR